jgi:glycosyltransferase involved in cell wall biosynthesis
VERGLPWNVSANIRWVENAEIAEVIQSYDVCLLPYVEASQSGVVAIAVGYGVPCVASPVGGLREQLETFKCGIVAESTHPRDLLRAIEELVGDRGRYRQCVLGSKDLASETSSWQSIVQLVEEGLTS